MRKLFLLLFCLAAPAWANQLDPVLVNDQPEHNTLSVSPEARRSELFVESRSVGVLDVESIEDGHVANQEDLFKRTPGVWVANQNGGDDVFLSIRGSGLSTTSFGRGIVSYQDGVPLSRLDNGTTNQLIDPLSYRYVEVYRGASALTLGASALGGAINYVSETGRTAPGIRLRTELGDYGWRANRITLGGKKGNMDGYLSLSQSDYRGYRDHSSQYNKRASGNFGVLFDNGIENRTYFSSDDAQLELPGSIRRDRLEDDSQEAWAFNKSFDTDRNWRAIRLANRTLIPLAGDQQLVASVFYNRTNLDHLPTPFVGIIDNSSESIGGAVDYRKHWSKGHTLLAGLRYSYGHDDNTRFQHAQNGKQKGNQFLDDVFRVKQVEAYAEQQWQVSDRWRVALGAQWVESERSLDDLQASVPPLCSNCPFFPQPSGEAVDDSYTVDMGGFSPKLGLSFTPLAGQTLFVQVAQSIGMPSGSELGAQPVPGLRLDQQEATTIELGWRGVGDVLDWDMVLYHANVEDELLNIEVNDVTALFNSPTDTIHQGLEAGITWRLPGKENVALQTVYNWSDFTFDDDPIYGDSQLPGIPEHTIFTALQWRPSAQVLVEPNLRYVSGYPLTYTNSGGRYWETAGYSVWGLRLSREFNNGLKVYFDGRNLGDKVYASTGSISTAPALASPFNPNPVASVTPGIGRSLYVGAEYRL